MTAQRLSTTAPAYLAHPAAGSGLVADGKPLDAGTAMILANNLAMLGAESLRTWGATVGPGTISYQGRGFDGYYDLTDPTVYTGLADERSIAWDRRVAREFGPHHLVFDRYAGNDGPFARKLKVACAAQSGAAGSLTLYAALTYDGESPLSGAIAQTSATAATSGITELALTPNVGPGSLTRRSWTGRPSGARGPQTAEVVAVTLWVGWRSTNGSDRVVALTAFEVAG